MTTWTDDHGVTHEMSGIVARCWCDIQSTRGPCANDDPPRVVTCVACVAEDSMERLFNDIRARGAYIDERKLEEARKLWAMEKVVIGTRT